MSVDLTFEKVMGWKLYAAVSYLGLNNGQLEELQSMMTRRNLAAVEDLIIERYLIFVPVAALFVIVGGFPWAWAGFKRKH